MTILIALISHSHALTVQDFTRDVPKAIQTSSSEFVSTLSPCLDALAANYAAAGCSPIMRPEPIGRGTVEIMCGSPGTVNGWTLSPVAVILTANSSPDKDIPGWAMFCVDPNTSMYIPRPESTKR